MCRLDASTRYCKTDFPECFILMDKICSDKGLLGLVYRRGEWERSFGLGWVESGDGGGVERKQENTTRLYVSIIGESTSAYESIFVSNKLQSVYRRGKSAPISR